jgi:hypothetical protein
MSALNGEVIVAGMGGNKLLVTDFCCHNIELVI